MRRDSGAFRYPAAGGIIAALYESIAGRAGY
jgi:hypothetical protein